MSPDLSLLPYDERAPRDADGVPLALEFDALEVDDRVWVIAGRKTALDRFVPPLLAGDYTAEEIIIDHSILTLVRDVTVAMAEKGWPERRLQAWRLGFTVEARRSKRHFLASLSALNQAADAAAMIAAGLGKAADAIDAANRAMLLAGPETPPAGLPGLSAPHSAPRGGTGVIHRRLRPEDFGVLPSGRKD